VEYHLDMRFLVALVLILVLAGGGAYYVSGRGGGPSISITKPEKFVGLSTPLEVTIGAPGANLKAVTISFEQNGKSTTLYSMANGEAAAEGVKLAGPDALQITRTLNRTTLPEL
jgi:hypothetical protein